MSTINRNYYHLVDRSPWPIMGAFSAFLFLIGLGFFMHRVIYGAVLFFAGLLMLVGVMYLWWRDIIRESIFLDLHTLIVQKGLKIGFILFIVSEVMFFFGFFWAFFASSISPSIFVGGVWPPVNLAVMNPYGVPLLNTVILLLSGCTITWLHNEFLLKEDDWYIFLGFFSTLCLATIFILCQLFEYFFASFNITDSVYGTTFYSLTGLHGLHVFIGTVFIFVCLMRNEVNQYLVNKSFVGLEFSIWYWHFVDVVWLFLFIFVYVWGSW